MLWVHFEILCLRQIKKTFETKRPRLAEVFSPSFLKRTLNISRTLSLWCCGLVSGYELNGLIQAMSESPLQRDWMAVLEYQLSAQFLIISRLSVNIWVHFSVIRWFSQIWDLSYLLKNRVISQLTVTILSNSQLLLEPHPDPLYRLKSSLS